MWCYSALIPVVKQAESGPQYRFVLVPGGKKVGEQAEIIDPAWFVLACLPEIAPLITLTDSPAGRVAELLFELLYFP